MKMIKLFAVATLLLLTAKSNAGQLSLSYFPFNNTLSITSNPERLFFVDGRLETNTFFGNINPELFWFFNLKRTKLFNVYAGLSMKSIIADGFNYGDFIGGYSLSVGSRFKPFEKYRNVHFLFELSPYFNNEFNSGTLRAYLGVSWHFLRKE